MDEEEQQSPPWHIPELFAAFLLMALLPAAAFHALRWMGAYSWLYGPELVELAMAPSGKLPAAARTLLMLWATLLALPLQVVGVVLLMRQGCGATAADLGLTRVGAGWSMLAGLGLAVVLVPAGVGVQALWLWLAGLAGEPVEEHAFTKLARGGLWGVEWVLLGIAACVAAPVIEELMFRGLIQRWAVARRAEGGATVLAMALLVAVALRVEPLLKAETFLGRVGAMMPALCVVGLAVAWWPMSRRPVGGVFATAVLFAFVHSGVWPSPVPLLLLAGGLGWLAFRWPTLAGPMLLHAVFNAVAFGLLLLG